MGEGAAHRGLVQQPGEPDRALRVRRRHGVDGGGGAVAARPGHGRGRLPVGLAVRRDDLRARRQRPGERLAGRRRVRHGAGAWVRLPQRRWRQRRGALRGGGGGGRARALARLVQRGPDPAPAEHDGHGRRAAHRGLVQQPGEPDRALRVRRRHGVDGGGGAVAAHARDGRGTTSCGARSSTRRSTRAAATTRCTAGWATTCTYRWRPGARVRRLIATRAATTSCAWGRGPPGRARSARRLYGGDLVVSARHGQGEVLRIGGLVRQPREPDRAHRVRRRHGVDAGGVLGAAHHRHRGERLSRWQRIRGADRGPWR